MDPFSSTFDFKPIPFTPPEVELRRLSNGARVLFLVDKSLPLVNLYGEVPFGYAHLPGPGFVAGYSLDDMMRTGGTESLISEDVDLAIEDRAMGLELEVSPRTTSLGLNTLSRHMKDGISLLFEMLLKPRFDPHTLKVWKGRQLDALKRKNDRPGPIAHRTFNRLMYPGHPLGRSLEEEDVQGLTEAHLREAHGALVRPDIMTIGVCGDVDPDEAMALLESHLAEYKAPLPAPAPLTKPKLRREGGVFLVDRPLPQATLMAGHSGGITMGEHEDYFASRILNFILGGSGFTSRLTREMRTVRGYAYSARTSWGATVDGERSLYALTETRNANAMSALQLIHDIFQGMIDAPPLESEISIAKENMRNSFLFEFEMPNQVVNRQVSHLTRGLPRDWFERYLRGIGEISREQVFEVGKAYLRPKDFTIVVVGDGAALRAGLSAFGPVQDIQLEG